MTLTTECKVIHVLKNSTCYYTSNLAMSSIPVVLRFIARCTDIKWYNHKWLGWEWEMASLYLYSEYEKSTQFFKKQNKKTIQL